MIEAEVEIGVKKCGEVDGWAEWEPDGTAVCLRSGPKDEILGLLGELRDSGRLALRATVDSAANAKTS